MKYTHTDKPINAQDFSMEKLVNPPTMFHPVYTWVWSTPVTKEEITRQIDIYAKDGIKQLYILPEPKEFRPTTMPTTLHPDYLSEEYFEIYRFAFEYAEKKGMKLWLYDEGGWPSGGACTQVLKNKPHLESKRLAVREVSSPYTPGENAVAGYCEGKRIEPGFLSDKPITEYYMAFRGLNYPNMSDPEATDEFIRLTHEGYKKHIGHMFGKSVTAVFTDEPISERTGWYPDFPEIFKQRYGYDILDHLPLIFLEPDVEVSEEDRQIRIDFMDLQGEMFAENFFLKIRNWCRENNLLSTGHLDDEDSTYLPKHRFFNALRQLRYMDMPGIDVIWRQIFPGKRNHYFPRLAASAANQTGNPYTMTETYSVYGAGLTFDQMRHILLYQLTRGITIFNFMTISYSYNGLDRKAARPGFMPLLPKWRHLGQYNLYTARMSYLASLGISGNKTAVFTPVRDFWAGGKKAEMLADSFDKIIYLLEEKHCPVDIIDEDFLETSYIKENSLCTGTASYDTVIMQRGVRLSEESEKKLSDFVTAGGLIVYDDELDKAQSAVLVNSEKVNVFKRVLENGTLYILHSDSTEEETVSVKFKEQGNIYEICAENAKMYIAEPESITFAPGEGKVYFITDKEYPAEKRRSHTSGCIVIDNFEIKRGYSFIIGEETFEKHIIEEDFSPATPGDWCERYGKGFCGEVIYKIEFDLDAIPESIEIDLGQVNYSCDLTLNGKTIDTLCYAPYKVTIEKDLLQNHNTLLVRVANTHANQYVTTTAFDNIPENIIGPYHAIAKQFESESLCSGLMSPVIIKY